MFVFYPVSLLILYPGPHSVPKIQVQGRQRFSKYHLSDVMVGKGPPEAPGAVDVDAYADYVEWYGSCDFAILTGGPALDHWASILVHYDQLQDVCSTAILIYCIHCGSYLSECQWCSCVISQACC